MVILLFYNNFILYKIILKLVYVLSEEEGMDLKNVAISYVIIPLWYFHLENTLSIARNLIRLISVVFLASVSNLINIHLYYI